MSQRPLRRPGGADELDPLSGLANFFDLGIVFALGFMLALMGYARLEQREATPSAGEEVPDEARRQRVKLKASSGLSRGPGQRLGVAYRLASGEIVYVPEGGAPSPPQQGPPNAAGP